MLKKSSQGTDGEAMTPSNTKTAESCRLLERFGDSAGRHGPLAAVRVKLSGRISREANLRLSEIARLNGLRPGPLQCMALEAFSKIEPSELYPVLAELTKQRKP